MSDLLHPVIGDGEIPPRYRTIDLTTRQEHSAASPPPQFSLTAAEALILSRVELLEHHPTGHYLSERISEDGSLEQEYTERAIVTRCPRIPVDPVERRHRYRNPDKLSVSAKDWLHHKQGRKISAKLKRIRVFHHRAKIIHRALWVERKEIERELARIMAQDPMTQLRTVEFRAALQRKLMMIDHRLNFQKVKPGQPIRPSQQDEVDARERARLDQEVDCRATLQYQLAQLNLEPSIFSMDENRDKDNQDQSQDKWSDDDDNNTERALLLAVDEPADLLETGLCAVSVKMSKASKPKRRSHKGSKVGKKSISDSNIEELTALQEPRPETHFRLPNIMAKLQEKVKSTYTVDRSPAAYEAHIKRQRQRQARLKQDLSPLDSE